MVAAVTSGEKYLTFVMASSAIIAIYIIAYRLGQLVGAF